MSLLHDQDYVISHLRATYLERCPDGVGERIIRPSHLYITKGGPKTLNWAASTLISKARPDSPPIPTDTMTRAMPPMRNGFSGIVGDDDDDDDDSLTQLRGHSAVNSVKGSSLGGRRRASTLPDVRPESEKDSWSLSHHSSTENLRSGYSINEDQELDESVLGTVYENDLEHEDEEVVDSDEYDEDEEEEDEDIEDALSGLSEEDDSDIEEELQFAAQQIKRHNNLDQDADSATSDSRPPSATTSPKARRRKDPARRSKSNETTGSPVPINARSVAPLRQRAMSARSGNSNSNSDLWSPQIPFKDTDSMGASFTDTWNSQDRLDSGLGLTKMSSQTNLGRDRSGSLFGPPLKPLPKPGTQSSLLTRAILAKQSTFDNPLEQYIAASGRSASKPVRLKMFMPSSTEPKKPWETLVHPDCTTHLAIGFALYCYSEQGRQPELTLEQCDANYWNLRIVEDDGEPDEDFPALDRTRHISAYSFDEFALVPATAEQMKENEKKTPNTKKPTAAVNEDNSGQKEADDGEESGETADIKVFQYPFNEMTSPLFWEATVGLDMYVGELLIKMCKEMMLDDSMYALKIAGSRMVIGNELKVGTLRGQYTLELTPRRVITQANGYVEPQLTDPSQISNSFNQRTQNVYTALALRGAEDARRDKRYSKAMPSAALPEVLNTTGYRKYMVWRRQPMSFNSRHERILAIDGEYVHIMPSEEKTFMEAPKTSSFHISRVLKCKQSRKVPANFKIVVRKDSGPKRYDLEATSSTQAVEITAKIRSLANTYRHT